MSLGLFKEDSNVIVATFACWALYFTFLFILQILLKTTSSYVRGDGTTTTPTFYETVVPSLAYSSISALVLVGFHYLYMVIMGLGIKAIYLIPFKGMWVARKDSETKTKSPPQLGGDKSEKSQPSTATGEKTPVHK